MDLCQATRRPSHHFCALPHIPARSTDPATSNNRAEVAGILVAMEAARQMPARTRQLRVWSDSDYAVNCETGQYRRKANLDLWATYDALRRDLAAQGACELTLQWLKGHAGNRWNEVADELATRGALNFDEQAYGRYRAAQKATGREMPGMPAGSAPEGAAAPAPRPAAPVAKPEEWIREAHYTLVLCTHLDGQGQGSVGRGPASGRYQLWTRERKGYRGDVRHPGEHAHEEGEYLTLIVALRDLIGRIEGKDRTPATYTVDVYSRRELLVKQIRGEYRVKAETLQPLHREARALLDRFERAEVLWRGSAEVIRLLRG